MNRKIFNRLNQLVKHSPHLLLDSDDLRRALNGVFGVDIENINTSSIGPLVCQIDEAVVRQYFAKVWQPETKKYKYSGLSIIDEVNSLNPENVLDVGCGYNEFKGKIQNLTGIDAYNDKADIKTTTMDYQTEMLYDIVICFGSINFGSADKIIKEMQKVVSLTKQNGLLIFRVNPGIQHKAHESRWIDFFEWDTEFIMNIAHSLNCKVIQIERDNPKEAINGERFYFVLKKLK